MFNVMRSYYQNTPYDLSKQYTNNRPGSPHNPKNNGDDDNYRVAAGPYGSSFRAHPGRAEADLPEGRWERSIATWKTQVSVVICTTTAHVSDLNNNDNHDDPDNDPDAGLQRGLDGGGGVGVPQPPVHAHDDVSRYSDPLTTRGVVWFAPHAAHTAIYLPFLIQDPGPAVNLTAAVSGEVSIMGPVDRSRAFWANRYVFTMSQPHFSLAIQDINRVRTPLENSSMGLITSLPADNKAAALILNKNAEDHVASWWTLSENLLIWYAEGNCNSCGHETGSDNKRHFGYANWWLQEAGYTDPLP